jgi:hypothetical protein
MRAWSFPTNAILLWLACTSGAFATDVKEEAERLWHAAEEARFAPLENTGCAIWRDWRWTFERLHLLELLRIHPGTIAGAKASLRLAQSISHREHEPDTWSEAARSQADKIIRDTMAAEPSSTGLLEAVQMLWDHETHGDDPSEQEQTLRAFLISRADALGADSAEAAKTLATTLAHGELTDRMSKLIEDHFPQSPQARQIKQIRLWDSLREKNEDFTDEEPSLRAFVNAYPGTTESLAELGHIAGTWGRSNVLAFPVKGRPDAYTCMLHSMQVRCEIARLAPGESSRYLDEELYFEEIKVVEDPAALRSLFLEYFAGHPLHLLRDVLMLGAVSGHDFKSPLEDVKFYQDYFSELVSKAAAEIQPLALLSRAYFFECLAREMRLNAKRAKDNGNNSEDLIQGATSAETQVDQAAANLIEKHAASPAAIAVEDLLAIKAVRLEHIDDALKHWHTLVTRVPSHSLSLIAALHAAKVAQTPGHRASARQLLQAIKPDGDDLLIARYSVPAALGLLDEADYDLAKAAGEYQEGLQCWPALSPVRLFPRYFSADALNGQFLWGILPEPSLVRDDAQFQLEKLQPYKSTGYQDLAIWRRMLAADGEKREDLLNQMQREFPSSRLNALAIIEQGKWLEAQKEFRKARAQYFKAAKLRSSVAALIGAVRLAHLDFEGLGFREGEPKPENDELIQRLNQALQSYADQQPREARSKQQAEFDAMMMCFWKARLQRFEADLSEKWLLLNGTALIDLGKERIWHDLPSVSSLKHVIFIPRDDLTELMAELKSLRGNEAFRTSVLERVWLGRWMFDLKLPDDWPQHNQFVRPAQVDDTLQSAGIREDDGINYLLERSDKGWRVENILKIGMFGVGDEKP